MSDQVSKKDGPYTETKQCTSDDYNLMSLSTENVPYHGAVQGRRADGASQEEGLLQRRGMCHLGGVITILRMGDQFGGVE